MTNHVEKEEYGWEFNDLLCALKWDIRDGLLSDWDAAYSFPHVVEMTWDMPKDIFMAEAAWYDQLCDLLVDMHVESLMPNDHTDSLGDVWAHIRGERDKPHESS